MMAMVKLQGLMALFLFVWKFLDIVASAYTEHIVRNQSELGIPKVAFVSRTKISLN